MAFLLKTGSQSKLKLSKRLQQIDKMVTSPKYVHIWDCCCDHGLLGFALLSRQAANNIHFVDIIPELMTELENKLQRFYPNDSRLVKTRWKTHCLDVEKLPLRQHKGKHLVIIAGVGGDLMIQFIEAIHQNYPNLDIDFLLCPVHHQFSVRKKLIELDFSLQDEVLIEENKRFYEILHVSSTRMMGSEISPIGDKMWLSQPTQDTNKSAEITTQYLNKTLKHYQRIQQGFRHKTTQNKDIQDIIDAYSAIAI